MKIGIYIIKFSKRFLKECLPEVPRDMVNQRYRKDTSLLCYNRLSSKLVVGIFIG